MDSVTISNTSTNSGERLHQVEMPTFGLGVYLMGEPGECKNSVLYALEQGYRMIDTAMAYGNEDEVGQAIRESGIPREEIFVVTKLRRPHSNSYEETIERCQQSLENLGLDYMDLYLVHAPPEDPDARAPVWQGMEECLTNGWTRSIGVSNYGAHHLDAMRSYASLMPSVNQVEISPWLQRNALRAAIREVGAVPMAYSPLARGHKVADPGICKIADSVGCTPAQAAIKWCLDIGAITIPKSSNPVRISENLGSLDVDLSGKEAELAALEESYVSGWDPTSEP
ncbi:MAG: glyoxal reductase [Candidatus Poseidoniales archaeon]|jgi:diketogulonate reductase-like aldo/keto reductase|nr:MAG: glyoxal reductase [Candidatus Poseidoniales archaeon]|tara:strand:- start:240 stop:1088 length:849 start_codon:yes stop_codon:yes gene_type:complete